MATKEDLQKAIKDLEEKRITQNQYLRFCIDNEDLVLDNCKTRRERFIVKNALKAAKRLLR